MGLRRCLDLGDMTDPVPFDEQAERLRIRSAPRPVTRINRKVLLLGAGLGVLALFAAASIALSPPRAASDAPRELYNTSNKRTPDGLTALPASYGDIAPLPSPVPELGPPLPGDLGDTILSAERGLGIDADWRPDRLSSFTPNPADEAERARQLRLAKQADDAAKAPVFFQLQSQTGADRAAADPQAGWSPDASSELLALAASGAHFPGQRTGDTPDANLQSRKLAFAGERHDSEVYNPHEVQDPRSPYQLMAGTLISASLITGINSDLPGAVIAQVTQPVFDTVTGDHVLVPQGSRLIGRYQSEVSFGQNRALVTWDRIIFPNGASIQISSPGADAAGYTGLADRTDHHWGRVFSAAGLATLLGIGSQLGQDSEDDIARAIRRGFGDTISQTGERIVDRQLGIQPTIKVRPGWPVRVIVTRDLVLRPHTKDQP